MTLFKHRQFSSNASDWIGEVKIKTERRCYLLAPFIGCEYSIPPGSPVFFNRPGQARPLAMAAQSSRCHPHSKLMYSLLTRKWKTGDSAYFCSYSFPSNMQPRNVNILCIDGPGRNMKVINHPKDVLFLGGS